MFADNGAFVFRIESYQDLCQATLSNNVVFTRSSVEVFRSEIQQWVARVCGNIDVC